MERFLILFCLIYSLTANAAQNGGVPTAVLGASTVTPLGQASIPPADLAGQFEIKIAAWTTRTANHVQPFIKNGVLYQVPTGKIAHCWGGVIITPTAGNYMQLMYDTATFALDATTGSLTAPKYEGLVAGNWAHILSASGNTPNLIGGFDFPALSWPGIQISATDNYYGSMLCKEI